MSHHLFLTSNVGVPRRRRFPDRFVDDVAALVCAISADVAGRYQKVRKIEGSLRHSKLDVFSDGKSTGSNQFLADIYVLNITGK